MRQSSAVLCEEAPWADELPGYLVRNRIMVTWVSLGEGFEGDHNPDDPDDVDFLRFDVYGMNGSCWEAIDNASYCTQMPVTCSYELLMKGLEFIMEHVEPVINAGLSVKKICERLSWISPGWFESQASMDLNRAWVSEAGKASKGDWN